MLESESESNSETDLTQPPDSGLPDNGQPDDELPDNGQPDTGLPGAGQPGTGQPDNGQPSPGNPPGNQETLPDETETESQSANEWANPQYETNSLDDFLNRLTGGSLTLP